MLETGARCRTLCQFLLMSSTDTIEAAPAAPVATPGSETGTESADLFLPSLFISAAATILALQDPINLHFEARPAETLVAVVLGVALLAWAAVRRSLPLLVAATGLLLGLIAAGVFTQPAQLNAPAVVVWPLRLALVLLVACSWAFLMRPPSWLRRALMAAIVPTLLVLAVWGGPVIVSRLLGTGLYIPSTNFAPYWVTVDSHGTLYASDADGGFVWAFDATGNPQGTLQPAKAPPLPTPGPGIIPAGFDSELNLPGIGVLPTATPITGTLFSPFVPRFEFCGLVTDPQNNLYTVDLLDQTSYKLLRFDGAGNITARWPLPQGYEPTSGCLAADAGQIYLSSRDGRLLVLDHAGKLLKQINLHFQSFGISPVTEGKLVVAGPQVVERVDTGTGQVVSSTLPAPLNELQIPMLAMPNGDVWVTNHQSSQIVLVNLDSHEVLSTIGGPGTWPGQFDSIGGLARDGQGRIYVSDYTLRVIQRFTPDGKIDAVWWATRRANEVGEEG